jgi:hypothetical protein
MTQTEKNESPANPGVGLAVTIVLSPAAEAWNTPSFILTSGS